MRAWCLAVPVFLGTLVVACGDDEAPVSGGGAPSAGPIAESQLLAQYTAAYCDTLGPCCGKYSVPFDKANCTSVVGNALKQPFADSAARSWTYDADAAGKCIAAIRAVITACDASAINPADLVNAGDNRASICRHIYSGSKPLGAACDSTSDCAQPSGKVVTCAASLCRDYQVGGSGATCKSVYDEETPEPYLDCSGNLKCLEANGSSTCGADPSKTPGTKREGEACKDSKECASNRCFQSKCFTDKMGILPESCANPLK